MIEAGDLLLWRGQVVTCLRYIPDEGIVKIHVVHPIIPPSKHAQEDFRTVSVEDVSLLKPKQLTLF